MSGYGDPVLHSDGPGPCNCGLPHTVTPTPPPGCPMCHRLADAIDLFRDANDRLTADVARLTADVRRLTDRYERTAP